MPAELEALLNGDNFAQLATINTDGTPHIDTVWFGHKDGHIIVATTTATLKARNLAANGNGYIVITNKSNPYEQAQIKVRLATITPDEDMVICDEISQRYIGKAFPQRHHAGRVAIFFEIVKARYHRARV